MNKLIKNTIILALSSISAEVYAAECKNFHGPYVGLGAGIVGQHIRHQDTSIVEGVLTTGARTYSAAQSPKVSLGVGYSGIFKNKFYSALELRAEVQSLKSALPKLTLNISGAQPLVYEHNVKIKNNFNFDLLLKPGALVASQMVMYGIVGAELRRFHTRLDTNIKLLGSSFPVSSKKTRTKVGIVLGFGTEAYLAKAVSIGLEYVYTYYGKVPGLRNLARGVPIPVAYITTNKNVYNNTGLLNLRYHF